MHVPFHNLSFRSVVVDEAGIVFLKRRVAGFFYAPHVACLDGVLDCPVRAAVQVFDYAAVRKRLERYLGWAPDGDEGLGQVCGTTGQRDFAPEEEFGDESSGGGVVLVLC